MSFFGTKPATNVHESMRRGFHAAAEKYPPDHQNRLHWYGSKPEDLQRVRQDMLDLIPVGDPDHPCRVMDVGCGTGHFGEMVIGTRPDLTYVGFDYVQANVDAARERLPGADIWLGDYWEVLERPRFSTDYIVSFGVLFSTTERDRIVELFRKVERAAQKGFVIVCLHGPDGVPAPLDAELMAEADQNSVDPTLVFWQGPKGKAPAGKPLLRNRIIGHQRPLILIRDARFLDTDVLNEHGVVVELVDDCQALAVYRDGEFVVTAPLAHRFENRDDFEAEQLEVMAMDLAITHAPGRF